MTTVAAALTAQLFLFIAANTACAAQTAGGKPDTAQLRQSSCACAAVLDAARETALSEAAKAALTP
ncbi:MAG TPA: hypothetical protein PLL10_06230, partial [Elusimicrobiales bacterium]|nr:hypothetical protein [Elusimicrobiales bacterium]